MGTSRARRDSVTESLGLKRALNDTLGIAVGMDMLSWVAAAELRYERAATLMGRPTACGVASASRSSDRRTSQRCGRAPRRRSAATVILRSTADGYERGNAFDLEQAIAFALDEPDLPVAEIDRADPAVGLTRRESEVAELVAQGHVEQGDRGRLVISQRTAEGHVQRILTKFGFTSRAQVATWVANQRASQGA